MWQAAAGTVWQQGRRPQEHSDIYLSGETAGVLLHIFSLLKEFLIPLLAKSADLGPVHWSTPYGRDEKALSLCAETEGDPVLVR